MLKVLTLFKSAIENNKNMTHNERDGFINKIVNEHEKLLYNFELDLYDDEP